MGECMSEKCGYCPLKETKEEITEEELNEIESQETSQISEVESKVSDEINSI